MNYKKRSLVLGIFFILSIQILILINNKQKTSFRYFIWNVEEVSIGRLVFISFMSGLLISSVLGKSIDNDFKNFRQKYESDKPITENDNSLNIEDNDEINEIPPDRDLREAQPTISVNYRVIKDNSDNEITSKNKTSKNPKYQDDWNNKELEW